MVVDEPAQRVIHIKQEQLEKYKETIGRLNAKLGIEIISDDESDMEIDNDPNTTNGGDGIVPNELPIDCSVSSHTPVSLTTTEIIDTDLAMDLLVDDATALSNDSVQASSEEFGGSLEEGSQISTDIALNNNGDGNVMQMDSSLLSGALDSLNHTANKMNVGNGVVSSGLSADSSSLSDSSDSVNNIVSIADIPDAGLLQTNVADTVHNEGEHNICNGDIAEVSNACLLQENCSTYTFARGNEQISIEGDSDSLAESSLVSVASALNKLNDGNDVFPSGLSEDSSSLSDALDSANNNANDQHGIAEVQDASLLQENLTDTVNNDADDHNMAPNELPLYSSHLNTHIISIGQSDAAEVPNEENVGTLNSASENEQISTKDGNDSLVENERVSLANAPNKMIDGDGVVPSGLIADSSPIFDASDSANYIATDQSGIAEVPDAVVLQENVADTANNDGESIVPNSFSTDKSLLPGTPDAVTNEVSAVNNPTIANEDGNDVSNNLALPTNGGSAMTDEEFSLNYKFKLIEVSFT